MTGQAAVSVDGTIEPGFEGVRDAFARNIEQRGDLGAAVAVHVNGRKVVDLWGGVADPVDGRPYGPDALQLVLSATKGVVATCANLLIERGRLDVDAPVARYWPEFARRGKGDIPVRWLLSHKAGLPVLDTPLDLDAVLAWDPVVEALAGQAPRWVPGVAHGYHALTFGWLVGELVRRVDGRTVGEMVQAEIARPLGLDLWIGLPASHEARVAPLVPPLRPEDHAVLDDLAEAFGPDTPGGRTLSLNGLFTVPAYGRREVRAAEVPAANGITDARSLSRLYAALLGPVAGGPDRPLLDPEQLDRARTRETEGDDRVLSSRRMPVPSAFGLGFMLSAPGHDPFGVAGAFGHPGAGGSLGFADPEARLAFAYTTNRLRAGHPGRPGDPRTRALVRAAYEAIGAAHRLTELTDGSRAASDG